MTQEPVSPLRRRMIEDMTIRQFGAKTQTFTRGQRPRLYPIDSIRIDTS